MTSPYIIYTGIIIGTGLLFTYIARKSITYSFYYLTAPFLMVLFYLCKFPIVLSIIIPILLIWRYIRIRELANENQEVKYLKVTFLLSVLIFLVTKEVGVLLFTLLQLTILFVGYTSSHFTQIPTNQRKGLNVKLSVYFLFTFSVSAAVIYFVFDYARFFIFKSWDILSGLLIGVLGFLTQVLNFINLPDYDPPLIQEETVIEGEENVQDLIQGSHSPLIVDHTITFLIITALVIVCFIIYLVYRTYKSKFTVESGSRTKKSHVTYEKSGNKSSGKSLSRRLFKKKSNKHLHPVRKLVYHFEQEAEKVSKGRRPSETIEEWFSRINIAIDFNAYEKVRYGEYDTNKKEVEKLRKNLLDIIMDFKK